MRGSSLIQIVQVGFKSLRLHKLRSGLTMLGMIIGVWAVIVLVAIGEGASHDAQEAIKALRQSHLTKGKTSRSKCSPLTTRLISIMP